MQTFGVLLVAQSLGCTGAVLDYAEEKELLTDVLG